jgi:hypothetical protein
LIFTVTATSEGLFEPLERCLFHLGPILIVLHSFLAQYFEPRLCISSASRWTCHFGRAKSITKRIMTDSLTYDISCLCFFHCLALLAVLNGCTVGTNWELHGSLWDARVLSGENGVGWKRNARVRKLSSPGVLNIVWRLSVHEVPGCSAMLMLGTLCWLTNTTHKLN